MTLSTNRGFAIGTAPGWVVAVLAAILTPVLTSAIAVAAERRVYRCESGGKVTYSDVACSGKPEAIEIERRLNTFDSDQPFNSSKPAPKAAPRRTSPSIAEEQARHKAQCKELNARIESITKQLWSDDSLRSRSKRTEQLKAQQTRLEAQRREGRCR